MTIPEVNRMIVYWNRRAPSPLPSPELEDLLDGEFPLADGATTARIRSEMTALGIDG